MVNLNESTTRFDEAFREVPGLVWLPWVGQLFAERPLQTRLLVVGESHYYWDYNTLEERLAAYEAYLRDLQCTRNQVFGSHIRGDWTSRTLTNIPKLFFKTTKINSLRMWGDSAFYNFVQRPMNYPLKERPTDDDFVGGWKVFTEIVRIIQPSHCLFIGVSASNYFDHSMANQKQDFGGVVRAPQVGGVWPRVANLKVSGINSKLIFVHHLSRCNALAKWHEYLQDQHADVMGWIATGVLQGEASVT